MSETSQQHKDLLEEEIRDLSSYLAGIPASLRVSGAFAADESRLTLLRQQLSDLQQLHQVQRTAVGQPPQIFLNYAREDEDLVSDLYQRLSAAGFTPLMDQRDIAGGNRWSQTLDKMIRSAHFFLACLSKHSITKRGVVEQEGDMALVIQQLLPPHMPYLIPVQLEPCDIPQKLRAFQAIKLFEDDGFRRLCAAIEKGMRQRFPRPRTPKQSTDSHSIVIQGTLVWSIFPAAGEVSVSARLCPEAPETLVHPKKLAELEQRFSKTLSYSGGGRYHMYDLSFMFPGGALFSAEHGFAVPEDWPFDDEDVRLGSDITEQFSLTVTHSGSFTVKRRRR